METDSGRPMWCPEANCWVRVLERRRLFGRDTARVIAEGGGSVFTVSADLLFPTRDFELADALSVVAGARIWNALGSDLFLAPLVSRVIPLPHQFRVLRRSLGEFPVRKLLADEVGLGKTIEAGLILKELKLRGAVEKTLVLAPKSLLLQWLSEMQEHFGEEFELVEPGSWGAGATLGARNAWKRYSQVVASFDLVKPREAQKGWTKERIDRFNLERFHDLVLAGWDLVIIDESHKVAGVANEVARYDLAKGVSRAAPNVLLLSATPHSGKSDAFQRLLSLLDPGCFAADQALTREKVSRYLIRTEKRTATDGDGKPLFTPRVTRLEKVPFEDRHRLQQELYENVSKYVRDSYNLAPASQARTGYFLLLLLIQRLVSSSTRAVRSFLERRLDILTGNVPAPGGALPDLGGEEPETEDVEQLALFDLEDTDSTSRHQEIDDVRRLLDLAIRTEAAGADARAEALYSLMVTVSQEEGDPAVKFLVFTEFTATQEMLREFLELRGYRVVTINGSMGLLERRDAQEEFRNEARVLISTDAGGEGINLQFAHVIFNYDLPWNPMRVEQRIGRVDRIGQTRDVRAFNLVLENSIEARIYDVWMAKLAVILQQLGVDKTGDVLDSKDAAAQFERLAKAALLSPDTFDDECERMLVEIKKAAQENLTFREFADTAVEESDRMQSVPLKSWLATLMGDNGTAGRDEWDGELDLSAVAIERINALRSHFAAEKPVPKLLLSGLGFELDCWFSIWKVGIAQGMWRQQHVFAMCRTGEGESFRKSAETIWDALAGGRASVTSGEEVADYDLASLTAAAESEAAELFEAVVQSTRKRAQRRLSAIDLSYLARKSAIKHIEFEAAGESRLKELEAEYSRQKKEAALASNALPDLQCLFLARVVVT